MLQRCNHFSLWGTRRIDHEWLQRMVSNSFIYWFEVPCSHSSSPSPHHLVSSTETPQPMEMTTVEEERTTEAEEERSTTTSTTEGKITTVEEAKMTTTEKNEEEERSTTSSPVTEGEVTTSSAEWTTESTIHTTKTTTVTIPTIPTKPMTTISPTNIFYASIVLDEVTTKSNSLVMKIWRSQSESKRTLTNLLKIARLSSKWKLFSRVNHHTRYTSTQ